ncbi:MAG: hypothetical protein ACRDJP_01520, partial [Actinomycetota bacterium]
MRVALFHNLPPGGARRAMVELVRRTSGVVTYDLYRIDGEGGSDRFVERPDDDLLPHVAEARSYEGSARSPRVIEPALRVRRLNRLAAQIAADIDAGGYDFAFVHHCRHTSSPAVLQHLRTPSIYFMQEPRRASFEYDRRPRPRRELPGPLALQRLGIAAVEPLVRAADISAARAADVVLCNSVFSAEAIWRAYGRAARVCGLGVDEQVFR